MWDAIDTFAPRQQWPQLSQSLELGSAVNTHLSLNTKSLAYPQVIGLLSDIARGLSVAQTSLRQALPEASILGALKVVGAFALQHGGHEDELLDELSLGATALQQRTGKLLGFKPDFARASQHRRAGFVRAIEVHDAGLRHEACQYWRRAFTREHLAVRPGPGWHKFLCLLLGADMNTNLISLKYSHVASNKADRTIALAKALAAVRVVFGRSVRELEQAPRGDGPRFIYRSARTQGTSM